MNGGHGVHRDAEVDGSPPGRDGSVRGSDGADDPQPPEVVDLRLVPSAATCWTGAALAVAGPTNVVRPVTALAVGAVVVLAGLSLHRRWAPRRGGTGRKHGHGAGRGGRVLPTAALALLTMALALVGGTAQRSARSDGVLGTALSQGATVSLTGVVVDGPVPVDARWSHGEPKQRFTLAARWVESRGRRSAASASVLVLSPGVVARGGTVRVTGRLGTPQDSSARAVATLSTSSPPQVVGAPSWPDRVADRVRADTQRVAARLPADPGGLLVGMALGDSSRVPDDLAEAMRAAGLTHLIAVSGSHFAIIGALVAGVAASCRLPRAARAGTVLAAGAGLLLLVGPQPSVLRAAVTGTVGLVGLLAGRPARAPAALAATVVVLLLVDPWLSVELGFVLSVVATAAIVLLGGAWVRRWSPRLGRTLASALAAPVAAQLACAPVLLVLRPTVGTYALLANLAAAPAVPPATVLGVLTALVAPWCPPAALVLAHLAGAACWWVATVARVAAAAPGAQLAWAPGAGGIVAMVGTVLAVAALLLHRGARRDAARVGPRTTRKALGRRRSP